MIFFENGTSYLQYNLDPSPGFIKDLFAITSAGKNDANNFIQCVNQIDKISSVNIDEILPSRFCTSTNAPLSFDQARNATVAQLTNFSTDYKPDLFYDLRDNVFTEVSHFSFHFHVILSYLF